MINAKDLVSHSQVSIQGKMIANPTYRYIFIEYEI